ncbi:MAG: hypothetical protein A3I79_01395 [Gemmatimonadetes bacterium RIFCSPLOWO2_02_FULL_71_11]|nr:MAG: hypothetical protein A3I79_01395 [Gemmatimonadetes bacterium RIFCSPLOWO2_02_FULL_71_11]
MATMTESALAPSVSLGHSAMPTGRDPIGIPVANVLSVSWKISSRLNVVFVRYSSFRFRL